MRVLVAGATGAVGRSLIPELERRGHEVFGTTRNMSKADVVIANGAQPVCMDGLDQAAVFETVRKLQPDAIVHQMTSLANTGSLRNFDKVFALTNQLRTRGTEYLVAAARQAGTRHMIVQSFTGWPNARAGSAVKTETDPLDPTPPVTMKRTLDSIRVLEQAVLSISDMHAVVLRYGAFYGPGTSIAAGGDIVEMVRRRRFPIIGNGAGVWSFIHIDDVAAATAQALEGGPSGVYNIVDDEPAPVRVWLPELALILGARPPIYVPEWVARLLVGESGVSMMTRIRGSSNEKARRLLGWSPIYSSWREGFRKELGKLASRH
jgi:nucleoside-diphosphate-sugar epimerase